MTENSADVAESARPARAFDSSLRVESQAVYLALVFVVVGAVFGLIVTLINPTLRLTGPGSFGLLAACAATVTAALIAAVGYLRSRNRPGQEWRQGLSSWTVAVNTTSVVLVRAVLAFLGTYVAFLVLSYALIGFTVQSFFGTVIMAITLGVVAYLVFPSVADSTTERMATSLLVFVFLGALTAAVTTSDPAWWNIHFSQLGTYGDLSSWIFNGTLIVGGLLVTTFAVYISHDMGELVAAGRLANEDSPRTVARLFIAMGIMLAGVGLVPVDVSFWIHTLSASGMAVMFLILLGGRKRLSGMPTSYFLSAAVFFVTTIVSAVLYGVGLMSLTALEVAVFGLIFGWITVFIRNLGLVAQGE
jgi:hypothetical membrane protein